MPPPSLGPACTDGRYCTVDAGYQGMLLELVLLTAVEHGWPLSALPGGKVAAALEPHGYDPRYALTLLVMVKLVQHSPATAHIA